MCWDADSEEWRCGNATLVRSDSNTDAITWCSAAGRVTKWTRAPPHGPIYFDAPADAAESMLQEWQQESVWLQWSQEQNSYEQGLWEWGPDGYQYDRHDYDDGWPTYHESETASPDIATQLQTQQTVLVELADAYSSKKVGKNNNMKHSTDSDSFLQVPEICIEECATAPQNVKIAGNRLDWALGDGWDALRRLPSAEHVASPMISVGSMGMQLQFFPNGTFVAEDDCSTVQLVRALDSTKSKLGIKFELVLNGRSSGPKACVGKSFMTDFPKPFGDSEEYASSAVTVSLIVLDLFECSGRGARGNS